tara:strand:+ start:381 stop:752 length:372 start_codon:yes stop_codon:yes gene_type:complete
MRVVNEIAMATNLTGAIDIMLNWNADEKTIIPVLNINEALYRKYKSNSLKSVRLDIDQLTRIGIIICIQVELLTTYTDLSITHNFMGKPNDIPYFEGKAPLDVIASGDIVDIYSTYNEIYSIT